MARSKHRSSAVQPRKQSVDPKVNLPDRNGWTPLMNTCAFGTLENVRKLIAAGADVNKGDTDGFGPMMCACVEGRTDVVQLLLASGVEVDKADELGWTPLSWVVTKGDFSKTAEVLLSAGADTDRADKDGFTPLMRAALMNHVSCFELLVRNGAETALMNPHWRKTALEMALERGSDELKKLAHKVGSGKNRVNSR